MKRLSWILMLLTVLSLSALVGCDGDVETDEAQASQLLRADRAERFFNSAPQQGFEMSWSAFSGVGFDDDSEIAYPIISAAYPGGCTEVAQKINDTIKVFLEAFLHRYGEIQILYYYGNLIPTVMRFDEEDMQAPFRGNVHAT